MVKVKPLPKGIRTRGKTYLWDVTVNGERRTGTATSLDLALLDKAATAEAMRSGKPKPKAPWSIRKAGDMAYTQQWAGAKAEDTHLMHLRLIYEFFGADTPISGIGCEEVVEWIKALEAQGNANATINRKLTALNVLLTTARDAGAVDKIPKMPKRPEYTGRLRFLTEDEEAQILVLFTQWEKLDHVDAICVLVDTGMRTGELWKLQRRDINIRDDRAVSVTLWETKSDQTRTVPLTSRASAILSRRILNLPETGMVFPFKKQWLRGQWDRAKSLMGLINDTQFVPHALRHTCASRLVQRGIGLKQVQAFLGHESIQTTMRYAHLSPNSLDEAAAALEKGWSNNTGSVKISNPESCHVADFGCRSC